MTDSHDDARSGLKSRTDAFHKLCDEFEKSWQSGNPHDLRELLRGWEPPQRAMLFRELLIIDVRYREKSGQRLDVDDYVKRFAELADTVRELFESLEPAARPLASTSVTLSTFGAPIGAGDLAPPADMPRRIGRYEVRALLGAGAFGRVFLAYDEQLHRKVAIKVPRSDRVSTPDSIELYLNEARIVAGLTHPAVAPVFDVGQAVNGECFVVSKFIDGTDLSKRIDNDRPSVDESARIVATIAEALDDAHARKIVHRDVKPANILLDDSDQPFVTDFGLALREDRFGKDGAFAGTPAYMSPEQARGEGHLVDGRSDIFSLGVVLYELLTGERPFVGETPSDILERIQHLEARPPRQTNGSLPKELERICLKCLAKRASDRYTTALDLANDLREFLTAEPKESARISSTHTSKPRIVPKGLRAFDEEDADFFLQLLPGPRGRDGLPESICFWKSRIESRDENKSFRVGFIYGPSGCGKSSFVKAGLLQQLSNTVDVSFVECQSGQSETTLKRRLLRRMPHLSSDLELDDIMASIRTERRSHKLLIVLDQFEQWMQAHRDLNRQRLVRALRQCDGEHVQCLVLVRDDFWLGVHRLCQELEVELSMDKNIALVDLLDEIHARDVLAKFGAAYGRLADQTQAHSASQARMLDRAVAELSESGKIAPVRLAVFADMIKGKEWTPATLSHFGGVSGVGVAFLRENFDSSTIPAIRIHQSAARKVLTRLLPEADLTIRGPMRSRSELLDASGYASQPAKFDDLVRILDTELRLITPVESCEDPRENEAEPPGEACFQLTHDFLVEAIRLWLDQHQRQTRRGRAEILLQKRTANWASARTSRNLPTLWEFLRMLLLTERNGRSDPQRQMMRFAGDYYLRRLAATLAIVGVFAVGTLLLRNQQHARRLVDELETVSFQNVPEVIREIEAHHAWPRSRLKSLIDDVGNRQDEKSTPRREGVSTGGDHVFDAALRARMALLRRDPSHLEPVLEATLSADVQQLSIIGQFLVPHHRASAPFLSRVLADSRESSERRLRAACVLVQMSRSGTEGAINSWQAFADFIADEQMRAIRQSPLDTRSWIDLLSSARRELTEPLCRIYRDPHRADRDFAATALSDYASGNAQLLADLLLDADAGQFEIIFSSLARLPNKGLATRTQMARSTGSGERAVRRRANAALALFRWRQVDELRNALAHSDQPDVRTALISLMNEIGMDADVLLGQLQQSDSDAGSRQASLLVLGETNEALLRSRIVPAALQAFARDPDPGVHAAADWLLRRWGFQQQLQDAERQFADGLPDRQRSWFVTRSQRHTMVVMKPAEFLMGRPTGHPFKQVGDDEHWRVIPRTFAVANKEVTIRQFREFLRETYGQEKLREAAEYTKDSSDECPHTFFYLTWQHAAAYCNWLSRKEGIPEEHWCYQGEVGDITFADDHLRRIGYRLPTEAEWECACRAGTTTNWFFGESSQHIGDYVWYLNTAGERLAPVGLLRPNPWGMFDMSGNCREWCHDYFDHYPQDEIVIDDARLPALSEPASGRAARVARGGYYSDPPHRVGSAARAFADSRKGNITRGFRVARTIPSTD